MLLRELHLVLKVMMFQKHLRLFQLLMHRAHAVQALRKAQQLLLLIRI